MIQHITTIYNFDNENNYSFDDEEIQVLLSKALLISGSNGGEAYMYAKLDENKAFVAIDSSGNGRHGAFQGGMDESNWTPGKIGSAIKGPGGIINFDDIANFEKDDEFSMEMWLKTTSAATMSLMGKQKNTGAFQGIEINIVAGKIRFVVRDDNGQILTVSTANTYNDGEWYHIVCTKGPGLTTNDMIIYIDENPEFVVEKNDGLTGSLLNDADFQISGRDGNNKLIDALTTIDECVVYARKVLQAEVSFRYNNGAGTQELPGPGTLFPTDQPEIATLGDIRVTNFVGADGIFTENGNDKVLIFLIINSTRYWHDGIEWKESTSKEEGNTLQEFINNIASFELESLSVARIVFGLKSDNGATTPEVLQFIINYDLAEDRTGPSLTKVKGQQFDQQGQPSQDVIEITLFQNVAEYSTENQIRNKTIYVTPDENGKWSRELADTESMESESFYSFKFTNRIKRKTIPKVAEIEFNNLEDFE